MIRRLLTAALASAAVILGLAAAPAGASTTPQGTLHSQFLGGNIAVGTTRLGDVRVVVSALPNLTAYTGPPDTVVLGDVLAPDTNGTGTEYGMGIAWNDQRPGACGPGLFTVEAGSGAAAGPALPLLPAQLSPVLAFGASICLAPGESEAIETYDSTGHHLINFEAGPTIAAEQVVGTIHGVSGSFFAAGKGVDVTNGTDAGLLPAGTLASFGASGLTQLSSNRGGSHQTRITFGLPTDYAVVGTVSGGINTPTNPITLQPAFAGPGSASTIQVP